MFLFVLPRWENKKVLAVNGDAWRVFKFEQSKREQVSFNENSKVISKQTRKVVVVDLALLLFGCVLVWC